MQLATKEQAKLFSSQPEVTQADQRASRLHDIEPCPTEEICETHYKNLKREDLGGRAVQLWNGTDVVLVDLNNNYYAIETMRCSKIPDKKSKRKFPPICQAIKAHPDVLGYPSTSDTFDEQF